MPQLQYEMVCWVITDIQNNNKITVLYFSNQICIGCPCKKIVALICCIHMPKMMSNYRQEVGEENEIIVMHGNTDLWVHLMTPNILQHLQKWATLFKFPLCRLHLQRLWHLIAIMWVDSGPGSFILGCINDSFHMKPSKIFEMQQSFASHYVISFPATRKHFWWWLPYQFGRQQCVLPSSFSRLFKNCN